MFITAFRSLDRKVGINWKLNHFIIARKLLKHSTCLTKDLSHDVILVVNGIVTGNKWGTNWLITAIEQLFLLDSTKFFLSDEQSLHAKQSTVCLQLTGSFRSRQWSWSNDFHHDCLPWNLGGCCSHFHILICQKCYVLSIACQMPFHQCIFQSVESMHTIQVLFPAE